MRKRRAWPSLLLLGLGACSPAPPAPAPAPKLAPLGKGYGAVTAEQVKEQRTAGATGASGDRFACRFEADSFAFVEDGRLLPAEMVGAVLGSPVAAKAIRGRWSLRGGNLKLSEITADDRAGFPDVTLGVFRTPVVRTYFGKTQYVLSP